MTLESETMLDLKDNKRYDEIFKVIKNDIENVEDQHGYICELISDTEYSIGNYLVARLIRGEITNPDLEHMVIWLKAYNDILEAAESLNEKTKEI